MVVKRLNVDKTQCSNYSYLDVSCLALVLGREHEHGPVLDVDGPKELLSSVVPDTSLGLHCLIVGIADLGGLDNLALYLHHTILNLEKQRG